MQLDIQVRLLLLLLLANLFLILHGLLLQEDIVKTTDVLVSLLATLFLISKAPLQVVEDLCFALGWQWLFLVLQALHSHEIVALELGHAHRVLVRKQ